MKMALGQEVLGNFITRVLGYFISFQNVDPMWVPRTIQSKGQQGVWRSLAAGGLGGDVVSASLAGLGLPTEEQHPQETLGTRGTAVCKTI